MAKQYVDYLDRKADPKEVARLRANMTADELKTADAEITARLKGPLGNAERILLVNERTAIRAAVKAPA